MVRRAALAFGLFLTPLVSWAAYNELPPGVVIQNNLGTNVFTYLGHAADSATGFVSGNALGANVQAALANGLNTTGGMQTFLQVQSTVQSAIMNAVNNASGLVQLNPSGMLPSPLADATVSGAIATATNAANGLVQLGGTAIGTNIKAALSVATNAANGLVQLGGTAIGTNIQAALSVATNAANGLVQLSGTAIGTGVQAALSVATNVANGLLVLNASGFIPTLPQVGVTTNSNAAAGNIGEVISSLGQPPTGTVTPNATATSITTVTLSAGDWDCWGSISTLPTSATVTEINAYVSPNVGGPGAGLDGGGEASIAGISSIIQVLIPTGTLRVSCTSSICTYIAGNTASALTMRVGADIFWTGTGMKAFGSITCRRMR